MQLTDTWWAPSDLIGLPTTIVRLSTGSPEVAVIASAISATVTEPNRRPPAPARTATLIGAASSLALTSAAWSWSRTAREVRAVLIDSMVFSRAAGPAHAEATRDQEVAAVAVLDLDHVAGRTEAGDFLGQDELHRPSLPHRPVEV